MFINIACGLARVCRPLAIAVWSGVLGLFVLSAIITYRLVLHPLARVPGPRLAAVSNIWYAWQVRQGRLFELSTTLHQRYGPAVRVGPDEVWFNTHAAYKAIYSSGSGFEKSEFYLATLIEHPAVSWTLDLTYPDSLDLLSERDMARYRAQRRAIRPIYSLASLQKHEQALDVAISRIIDSVRGLQGGSVDLREWMHASVVECLGAVTLGGWSSGYLNLRSDCGTSAHALMAWRRKSVLGLFPRAAVFAMMSKKFARAFNKLWGITHGIPEGFRPFFPAVQRKIARRIGHALAGAAAARPDGGKNGGCADLLDELIELHMTRPDEFPERYLRRMAMTNFGAGHETMTSAMVSILAMVGTHPITQAQIHDEIRSTVVDGESMTQEHVSQLSYTLACIKEAQRLYPVIGMSMSRTVPGDRHLELHGHVLPPGTTVGCVPAALHRNPDVFGLDADAFRPERWLTCDEGARRTMEHVNLTYGGGARTCPGKHLAKLIVYKLAARLVEEFEIVVDMPDQKEVKYYFLAMLSGTKARFLPRKRI